MNPFYDPVTPVAKPFCITVDSHTDTEGNTNLYVTIHRSGRPGSVVTFRRVEDARAHAARLSEINGYDIVDTTQKS